MLPKHNEIGYNSGKGRPKVETNPKYGYRGSPSNVPVLTLGGEVQRVFVERGGPDPNF